MPAKIDTELNLRFLYICFKHSNFSTVDFHEVASYFQIKAPAARMRLMRLRQALEAESNREGFREKDRKRRLNPFKAKDKMYNHDGEDDDDDEALDDVPLMQRLQARLMRIKREEGLMIKNEDGTFIKNEDGTMIKDEDGAMIKNEDDGFWGKKEEDGDEQEEKDVGGTSYFKNELDDTRSDLQTHVVPANKKGAVKSGNVSSPALQPNALYFGPAKMEIDPESSNYGFGNNQHTPTHPANFRTYGHVNTSTPYVHEQNTKLKPEHINVNNSDYSAAPFEDRHNSSSRSDAYSILDSFAQFKPLQSAYGNNTRATPPPSGHDSSFHLDMFNTALQTPVASSAVKARPRQEYDEPAIDSPMVQDDVEETASDRYYHSPSACQPYQNHNFR